MTDKHASEEVQIELHTPEPPDRSGRAPQSPTDELVAGMIRTMEGGCQKFCVRGIP